MIPGALWVGANFWSRSGGPLMWRSYDPVVVREELEVLREHGLNVTRSFFYWPDFMPAPDRIDQECVDHYQDFLDAHEEAGLTTIPTFIVGHMSGENWDPVWREGRDLYGDVWMVGRQAWFAERMTRRFHAHPAVAGWLITNEMPIYGGPAERPVVTAWAQLMVQAVRAGGATQPVSVGDGAWGAEVTGEHNGFSTRDFAEFTDFVGPHVYRMEDDVARQHYGAAFICELTGGFGLPVVLEEFGVTSDYVSDEHAAHYYRQVLHNTLLAGATGWIGWNNTDFDLIHQDPYRHHPFELHFGLTTADGTPKPQLKEVARFAQTLQDLDVTRCERVKGDAVLVVPEVMEGDIPFTYPAERTHIFSTLRQAYVSARAADLPIGVTRERDGIEGGASLYLVPSAKQLTAPGWHRLEELARQGATVYVSYSPGPLGIQRGPWYSHMNAMFGVEHQLVYGLADPIEDDMVELTFQRPFGPIGQGATLSFKAAGNEHSRAFLPVRPIEAEVIATDGHGRPALLRRRVGEGSIVLGTYPLEHMAAVTPRVNPEQTWRIYDALAVLAGVERPVTVADPRVSADLLVHEDGRRFAFLVSQSPDKLQVEASGVGTVTLAPYGVEVLEVIT
ncbi:cellulase family glycosylhydrolase [Nonomuraea sp. NBC_01738]|uniref:glycoside hydrolase 5 family protein n=1 Tax=Nonomuraea sp. NBC_01738 TaxID=2976003 RepID=UPI002E12ECBA|nr:cellulase family glycosylhydrolase [Nonomuraea sp. NBC_01738]